jgi:hypothetical protein
LGASLGIGDLKFQISEPEKHEKSPGNCFPGPGLVREVAQQVF